MIAVINNSQRQFDDWVKHWVHPGDRTLFISVNRREHLEGLRFSEVVRIGSYSGSSDDGELYQRALIRKQQK